MTIERQWIEIMKLEVPDAFSPVIPFVPEVGFIDAQIKLMFMPHENAWDVFMFKQFVLPVQHMFRDGASKVILAFDDYDNVPRAKSITQVCHQTYTLCLPKLIFCFCLVGRACSHAFRVQTSFVARRQTSFATTKPDEADLTFHTTGVWGTRSTTSISSHSMAGGDG